MKITKQRLNEIILEEVELHLMNDEEEKSENGEESDCYLKHEKLLEQDEVYEGEQNNNREFTKRILGVKENVRKLFLDLRNVVGSIPDSNVKYKLYQAIKQMEGFYFQEGSIADTLNNFIDTLTEGKK